jgi:DNA-binding CsgD family transcriptional regulator
MPDPSDDRAVDPDDPPSAYRQIRRHRGMSTREVAEAMGLELRNYQKMEKTGHSAKPENVQRFAEATDCDPVALALGDLLPSPRLAFRCADNKIGAWLVGGLADLEAEIGDGIRLLEAAVVLSEFGQAYKNLAAHARRQEAALRSEDDVDLADLRLTDRQIECLRWVKAGKSSYDIGQILEISQYTVDEHIGEACARLGVRTRVQAVAVARQLGLFGHSTP